MKEKAKYIADRIRLMISTRQFEVGEMLPSTRELGKQLETSFHTVRKAYAELAEVGLIEARKGSGYVVLRQNVTLDKEQRMELGAERIRDVVEELVGFGLSEDEIEALFDEQLGFIEWPDRIQSVATVAKNIELGQMLGRSVREQIGVKSRVLTVNEMDRIASFDALFVPLEHMALFKSAYEEVRLIPMIYHFEPTLLMQVKEYSNTENFSLVCRDPDTAPLLLQMLRSAMPLPSSIVAGSVENRRIPYHLRDVDRVLYTSECAALVEGSIPEKNRIKLRFQISAYSAELIRSELWE
jgi:DNA-binding transcriptional regulator YhcF (GntR family)